MAEWVWNALFNVWRIFVILSISTLIGVVFVAAHSWWNGADPLAAFTIAFLAVVLAGFAWHWIVW